MRCALPCLPTCALPPPHPSHAQLRLHLQMLSSLFVYVIGLSLMGLHGDGSPARQLINRECSCGASVCRWGAILGAVLVPFWGRSGAVLVPLG